MTCISLSTLNQEQEIRKAKIDDSDSLKELTITGKDFVCLAARDCQLQDGDVIQVCLDTPNTYLMVKLDATLDKMKTLSKREQRIVLKPRNLI